MKGKAVESLVQVCKAGSHNFRLPKKKKKKNYGVPKTYAPTLLNLLERYIICCTASHVQGSLHGSLYYDPKNKIIHRR